MLKDLKTQKRNGNEITARTIADWIMFRGSDARRANTKLTKEQQAEFERQAQIDSFEQKLTNLNQALGMVGSTADSCMSHIIKYGKPDSRSAGRVSSALSDAIKSLQQLQKELSL